MSEQRSDTVTQATPPRHGDMDLLDYVRVVWRHRWMIAALCAAALVIALALTLWMPRVYESTVTIIAPREGGRSGLIGSLAAPGLLQQVPGLSVPSLTPNRDLFLSVLKSRTVAQGVVERFRLQERYRTRYLEDAIQALRSVTRISVSIEGVLSVRVEDTDRALAAQMANSYIEQLDREIARYGTGAAWHERGFVSAQLAGVKANLDTAEDNLRSFQERNRAIVLQEQTRDAIEAAARLKGEIMATEVQLQVIRNFATDANPEVISLRRRLDEMNRQLVQMQYGDRVARPLTSGGGRPDFTVPFARVPELGLELARLTRDVKVHETLVALLTQQLEQVKIAEAKDLPIVQVLDRAVPAERHSRPSLRVNLAIAGVTSLFAGILLAFFLDYVRSISRRARHA